MIASVTLFLPAGSGHGFAPGYAVVSKLGASGFSRSEGACRRGGAVGTMFSADPSEELIGMLLVQIRPLGQLKIRDDMSSVTCQAIID